MYYLSLLITIIGVIEFKCIGTIRVYRFLINMRRDFINECEREKNKNDG